MDGRYVCVDVCVVHTKTTPGSNPGSNPEGSAWLCVVALFVALFVAPWRITPQRTNVVTES